MMHKSLSCLSLLFFMFFFLDMKSIKRYTELYESLSSLMQERNEVSVLCRSFPAKSLLLVGFTLFSMFFGAGNLIFPPHLGAQAGTSLWPAFAGLAVSAVGLPIAGVVAVARAGGLDRLAGRVHPVFAMVFTILVYLSIGPCLAIPRTASTSFQMLVPLIGGGTGLQLAYSVLFFGSGLSGGAAAGKGLPTGWAASSAPA